jgi:hypothetical protein
MLRFSQLQGLGLHSDRVDGTAHSYLSCSQSTSSTPSDLMPTSSHRVTGMRPKDSHRALLLPPSRDIGDLSGHEVWWRDWHRAIKARGYRLRPRYHPRWQPSWIESGKDLSETEDGQLCQVRLSARCSQLSP